MSGVSMIDIAAAVFSWLIPFSLLYVVFQTKGYFGLIARMQRYRTYDLPIKTTDRRKEAVAHALIILAFLAAGLATILIVAT